MSRDLDRTDHRILCEVQKDSSRTITEIAEAVGLSHAPCWRRIQRLRADGYILRESATLDRHKLGWEIEVFVFLKVSPHGRANVEEARRSIMEHEQIIGYYVLMGGFDAMLHVVARNVRDYSRFYLDHLATSPYLSEINSMTVMAQLKDSDLPV